ncbi:hypothetical protein HK102_010443, partial [Quaeritorhiza haematococci]
QYDVAGGGAGAGGQDAAEWVPGVKFEYFQGQFDMLPDFLQLGDPTSTGIARNLSIDQFTELSLFDTERGKHSDFGATGANIVEMGNFAVRFTGQLKVPQTGRWTFHLTSNDGSCLYLNGKKVVDNDGSHYIQEKKASMKLSAGIYPLTVVFFHTAKMLEGLRAGIHLSVEWACTSTGWSTRDAIARQQIPDTHLFCLRDSRMKRPQPTTANYLAKIAALERAYDNLVSSTDKRILELQTALEQERQHRSELVAKVLEQYPLFRHDTPFSSMAGTPVPPRK